MPWQIVTLDHDAQRPHMILTDRKPPGCHMRVYFDKTIEIFLGHEDLFECPVRAIVTPDEIVVVAVRYSMFHVVVLDHILASLDVVHTDRRAALAWMRQGVPEARDRHLEDAEWIDGNVAGPLAVREGWPFDLVDEDILSALRDPALPKVRSVRLEREAERRGLRARVGPE